MVSGRLNGADITRQAYSERYCATPYLTLATSTTHGKKADTTYGKLGVKVWICRGQVLPQRKTLKGGN